MKEVLKSFAAKFLFLAVIATLGVSFIPGIATAQQRDFLTFVYTHNMLINGQSATATALGTLDLRRGLLTYRSRIDKYILGYRKWPASPITLGMTSGGPVVALEIDGGFNLLSLTRGELGHKVQVTTTDQFASLNTDVQVTLRKDSVFAVLTSRGTANYPELVGMAGPVTLTQTPKTGGGFTERATKRLLAADGRIIETTLVAEFTGVNLPNAQTRFVNLQVLEESADGLDVTLRMQCLIRPANVTPSIVPIDYTHNFVINKQTGNARALGILDLRRGTIEYHSIISRYILGYKWWWVSPITKVLISLSPVGALELNGARNIFTLTNGRLGHTVKAVDTDAFANISTDIKVTREGDAIFAVLNSTGEAKYPEIVGIEGPLTITQTPVQGGFIERGTKRLITASGSVIVTNFTAQFDVPLTAPQIRQADLKVLNESSDRRDVSLLLQSSVRPAATQETFAFGVRHTPLGNAKLDFARNQLFVSNIGASGNDGVLVEAGKAGFLITTPEGFNADSLPTGATINALARGQVNGIPGQDIGVLRVTDVGNEAEFFCDFSAVGATSATVQVFNKGALVASRSGVVGPFARVRGPIICDPWDPVWPMLGRIWAIIDFPSRPLLITITGGQPVEGDRLVVIAEGTNARIENVTEVAFTAKNIASFTLVDQAVGALHLPHRALGQTRLTGLNDGEGLLASNLGASGEDGVSVQLDAVRNFDMGLQPLALDKSGAALKISATGTFGGRPNIALGNAELRNNNGVLQAFADFSAIGATNAQIAVYNNGVLVGETTVPSGRVVGTIAGLPLIDGCGKLPPIPPIPPCYYLRLARVAIFTASNGRIFQGDQIRLLAANAQGQITGLSAFNLNTANVGSFIIRPTAAQKVFAFGLQHAPLGDAKLEFAKNRLLVSNIGASGNDGVLVEAGKAGFLITTPEGFNADSLPTGATINATARGQVNGILGRSIGVLRVTDVGNEAEFFCDFSAIGGRAATVQVFNNGVLVNSRTGIVGPVARVRGPIICDPWDPVWPMGRRIWAIVDFPSRPLPITITGSQTVQGNRLVVIVEGTDVRIDHVSEVAFTAQNIASFALVDQAIGVFHLPNKALGQARVQGLTDGRGLVVSNLGDSGGDGLAVQLGDVRNFDLSLQPLALDKNGASLKLSATGNFNNRPNVSLGNAEFRNSNGVIQALADFSAIGATSSQIVVYNNGVFIGETTVPSGVIGAVTSLPNVPGVPRLTGCGKTRPFRPFPICIIATWDRVARITATNGRIFSGNEFRILAANPQGQLNSLATYSLNTANIESFTILNEVPPGERITTTSPLRQGFNLNALPVVPDVLNVKELIPSVGVVYGFTPNEGYKLVDHYQPKYGYWTNLPAAVNFAPNGNAIDEYTIPLPKGWSIIGGLSRVAGDPQPEPGIPITLFRLTPLGYQRTDRVLPGEAVWINVSEEVLLTMLPIDSTVVKKPASPPRREATILVTGEVVGTRVNVGNVVIGADNTTASTTLAPPSPPEYTTQVRLFAVGDFTNAYQSDIRQIQNPNRKEVWVLEVDPNGNTPPNRTTTVSWNAAELIGLANSPWFLHDGTDTTGAVRIMDMRLTTSLAVTGGGEQYFTIKSPPLPMIVSVKDQRAGQNLPDRFALLQNYPNPFNPETEIRYDLPKASRVTLTIFNLAGQAVRTLVDGNIPAGSHAANWNGRNDRGRRVAGGIYFYRLQAGKFVQTRKMILLP